MADASKISKVIKTVLLIFFSLSFIISAGIGLWLYKNQKEEFSQTKQTIDDAIKDMESIKNIF